MHYIYDLILTRASKNFFIISKYPKGGFIIIILTPHLRMLCYAENQHGVTSLIGIRTAFKYRDRASNNLKVTSYHLHRFLLVDKAMNCLLSYSQL